ncbi:hypothetical protein D3C83_282370 [compost metagenome]
MPKRAISSAAMIVISLICAMLGFGLICVSQKKNEPLGRISAFIAAAVSTPGLSLRMSITWRRWSL